MFLLSNINYYIGINIGMDFSDDKKNIHWSNRGVNAIDEVNYILGDEYLVNIFSLKIPFFSFTEIT